MYLTPPVLNNPGVSETEFNRINATRNRLKLAPVFRNSTPGTNLTTVSLKQQEQAAYPLANEAMALVCWSVRDYDTIFKFIWRLNPITGSTVAVTGPNRLTRNLVLEAKHSIFQLSFLVIILCYLSCNCLILTHLFRHTKPYSWRTEHWVAQSSYITSSLVRQLLTYHPFPTNGNFRNEISLRFGGNIVLEDGTTTIILREFIKHYSTPGKQLLTSSNIPHQHKHLMKSQKIPIVTLEGFIHIEMVHESYSYVIQFH